MFYKINNVQVIKDYKLAVCFSNGVKKIYDVKPLFEWKEIFNKLKENGLFNQARVSADGLAVIWNDEIDISSDELWDKGVESNHL